MSLKLEQCACCDYFSVDSNEVWEIYAVCYWEQDPLCLTHPDFASGAKHGLSLRDARRNFQRYSACAERWLSRVLPVGKKEICTGAGRRGCEHVSPTLFNSLRRSRAFRVSPSASHFRQLWPQQLPSVRVNLGLYPSTYRKVAKRGDEGGIPQRGFEMSR